MNTVNKKISLVILFTITVFINTKIFAQTDMDAIMMEKKQFCIGPMFGYSSWKNYWEGIYKRDNANLGTVSAQTYSVMGNYGITNKLNLLFNVPYIKTKASAGQLHSMRGLQDIFLWIKYMPVEEELGPGVFSIYTLGGLSFPSSNYVADYLPLSIGLKSTNLSLRLMADYQISNWFATLSGTYVSRSNVKIDRTSYYTTELHYTNEVKMPDAMQFGFRTGAGTNVSKYLTARTGTIGGYKLFGNNNRYFELGADIQYLNINEVSDDQKGFALLYPDFSTNTLYPSLNMGFRKYNKKSMFRAGASPGFTKHGFLPGAYLSFGFSW